MVRRAFQHGGRGRRRTIGEPLPIRVGELVRRQTSVAPELLRIDAALLERGVDERLQNLAWQQVHKHDFEVRA
jgi:hypothetical protein